MRLKHEEYNLKVKSLYLDRYHQKQRVVFCQWNQKIYSAAAIHQCEVMNIK